MALRFDEKKTAQAAARLLMREDGQMNVLKLVKLLYLTDRAALLRWGRPISFDWYFSLPHGPVLSFTLNKINEPIPPEGPTYWHQVISERTGYVVRLLAADPPDDELSPAEEALIDEIYAEFGGMDQWQLRDLTHKLPEWRDPEGSSIPIAIRDVLMSEGISEEDAAEVERDLEAESRFAQQFGA